MKALVIVPKIRSSNYLEMLASELPALKERSHSIREPSLPSLERLILVDNCPDRAEYLLKLEDVPSAIPFGELLAWDDPTDLKSIAEDLDQHDVINLQFTRLAFSVMAMASNHSCPSIQWDNRLTQSSISDPPQPS